MATSIRRRGQSIELLINSIFGSSLLWGTSVAFIFYACLPFAPVEDFQRYFTGHWTEYVCMCLFFIGVCHLVGRLSRIPTERGALQADLLEGFSSNSRDDAPAISHAIDAYVSRVAKRYEDTLLVKRVHDACEYVTKQCSAAGLEGHITYLGKTTNDRQRDERGLIRTVTWVVSILGILGTVAGISMAFANATLDRPESSLADIATGLVVAFDTIVLSLGLSALLTLGDYVVERMESRTLNDVDDFCMNQLLGQFPNLSGLAPASPLVAAEQQASDLLLQRSESMINWQMQMWQTSLEGLRERWTGTLSKQQESLDQALQSGLTTALIDHSRQLAEVRSEFVSAFQTISSSIGNQLAETRAGLAEQQHQGIEQIAFTWQQFRQEITQTRDEHARQLALLTQAISAEVAGWQNQLESFARVMNGQFEELRNQGEVFLKLSENETQLIRLETRLATNLESVRLVDSLEKTMLNLNAAVSLLTTRVKPKAA